MTGYLSLSVHGSRSILPNAECQVYLLFADDFTSWNVKHVLKILETVTFYHIIHTAELTLGNLTENVR